MKLQVWGWQKRPILPVHSQSTWNPSSGQWHDLCWNSGSDTRGCICASAQTRPSSCPRLFSSQLSLRGCMVWWALLQFISCFCCHTWHVFVYIFWIPGSVLLGNLGAPGKEMWPAISVDYHAKSGQNYKFGRCVKAQCKSMDAHWSCKSEAGSNPTKDISFKQGRQCV